MKDARKALVLLVIGLIVAVLVYPFLHELGHGLMSVILGGNVVAVTWLPLPSVISEVGRLTATAAALVGWGGLLLPALVSLLLKPRRFCLWYGVFVLRCISLLSYLLAAASALCYGWGHPLQNDDITTILSLGASGVRSAFFIALTGVICMAISLYKSNPKMHCYAYFCIYSHQ